MRPSGRIARASKSYGLTDTLTILAHPKTCRLRTDTDLFLSRKKGHFQMTLQAACIESKLHSPCPAAIGGQWLGHPDPHLILSDG